jgi:ABC-2 type transport system permease protein
MHRTNDESRVALVAGKALSAGVRSFVYLLAVLLGMKMNWNPLAPLFFANNASYPITLMPGWLQVLARFNPLTYEVDAVRVMMLAGGTSAFGIGWDFIILAIVTVVLV